MKILKFTSLVIFTLLFVGYLLLQNHTVQNRLFENTVKESTPSQTAWGIMALLAAGQIHSPELEKGLRFLTNKNLKYEEDYYTAVGFPKVFYLKYHGYAKYFPLLAISKIKNQLKKNSIFPDYGT